MSKQIGVLAMYMNGRRLEELSFFRKLCVSGEKLGVEVLVFTPDDVHENGTRIHTLTYKASERRWVRKWSGFPQVIYDRCRYHGIDNFRKISQFRKKYTKLRYLSKPLANKWTMHQLLSEHPGIAPHLPATLRYKNTKELGEFLKKHAIVFMKPKSGTGGRGIIRLQRLPGANACLMQGRDSDRRIISARKVTVEQIPARLAGWKLGERYIVQQGIPLELKDGRVHDFRMLVQKDGQGQWRVTGCAGRIGPRQSVTSNLHGGGSAISMESLLRSRFGSGKKVSDIRKEAYDLGIRIAHHLEAKFGPFCEAGLDLAVDPRGHVWLLEVNPKPSREVFSRIGEKETYRRAISRPLEYGLWLIRQKQSESS
ncbi:Glutathione synthase/RimK-type ligase, ATP-grasp superfamily [Paenibacillus sp. UNCCL117]|uniref:YheC/YheD family endospore coat-associated protein n=1 Tax=unclassified Paenibacillus TaxID=185978 RepID=UPI0008918062|nr:MULTISPECIES: YheC/YheD family protein [unclassified Paenibacillus]SDC08109.1 Glutathione synthase/RimK-type ligase, ATP-grasp superfamily [Paenibacillus sp. cl123]SFW38188.1 Glutathione synthase/RimK-type ligase, ATP-grasp superfamily [Paenibacillus sp. UNCCL117]